MTKIVGAIGIFIFVLFIGIVIWFNMQYECVKGYYASTYHTYTTCNSKRTSCSTHSYISNDYHCIEYKKRDE